MTDSPSPQSENEIQTGADAIAARDKHALLPWRIAFVTYIIALTIATHWPRLQLPEQAPAGDKSAHLYAFALFTILLWQTRWLRSIWLTGLASAIWSAVDEYSQGLPGVHRWVSHEDFAANLLGVASVVVWLWALHPTGASLNQRRHQRERYLLESIFTPWRTWRNLLVIGGTAVVIVAGFWFFVQPHAMRMIIVIMLVFTGHAMWLYLWRRRREEVARTERDHPCFACDEHIVLASRDRAGAGTCPRCDTTYHPSQWTDPVTPTFSERIRMAAIPFLVVLAVWSLLVYGLLLLAQLYDAAINNPTFGDIVPGVARSIDSLSRGRPGPLDLALGLIVIAIGVRMFRTREAKWYDRSVRCRNCGHDLRGSPTTEGKGVCPECGTEFTRRSS